MAYDPDGLFTGTAPYYARYRPGYSEQFIELFAKHLGLTGEHRVLDLGCGTGQLALPLSALVAEVVAVDPDADMLAWGWRAAKEAGIGNVCWQLGDSGHLDTLRGERFDFVTMGSSFHWMDRDAILAELDPMVAPDGAVGLARTGAARDEEPPRWQEAVERVRTAWLGPQRRAGSGVYTHPAERHEEVLVRSVFNQIETMSARWTMERDVESVIGLQFSMSFSAPALLGDRQDAYAEALRAALAPLAPVGVFLERLVSEAIVARRGRPGE